jgi:tetratricopeptide (TPR) repeat protein
MRVTKTLLTLSALILVSAPASAQTTKEPTSNPKLVQSPAERRFRFPCQKRKWKPLTSPVSKVVKSTKTKSAVKVKSPPGTLKAFPTYKAVPKLSNPPSADPTYGDTDGGAGDDIPTYSKPKTSDKNALPAYKSKKSLHGAVPTYAYGTPDTSGFPSYSAIADQQVADGDKAFAAGDYDRAHQIYKYVTRTVPGTTSSLVGEARVHFVKNQLAEAKDKLNQAIKLGTAVGANRELGRIFLAEGNFKDARIAFEKALVEDPVDAFSSYQLAQLLADNGDLTEADKYFARAAKLDPTYTNAAANVSWHQQVAGKTIDAVKTCTTALKTQRTPQLLIQLALLQEQNGDYGGALATLKEARSIANNPEIYEHLAIISGARGYWEPARDYARTWVELEPNNVNARATLAWCTLRQNEPADARDEAQQLVLLDVDNPQVRNLFGLVLMEMKRETDAEKEFSLSLDLQEKQNPAQLNLIMMKVIAGDFARADELATAALQQQPNDGHIMSLAAYAALKAGDASKAAKLAESALKTNAGEGLALLTLSQCAAKTSDHTAAKKYLEKALQFDGQNTFLLTEYAQLLLNGGDPHQAGDIAQRALQLAPTNILAKKILGISLVEENNYDGAIFFLKECAARRPKDSEVRLKLAEAQAAKGDLEECAKQCLAVLETDKKNKSALDLLARFHIRIKKSIK